MAAPRREFDAARTKPTRIVLRPRRPRRRPSRPRRRRTRSARSAARRPRAAATAPATRLRRTGRRGRTFLRRPAPETRTRRAAVEVADTCEARAVSTVKFHPVLSHVAAVTPRNISARRPRRRRDSSEDYPHGERSPAARRFRRVQKLVLHVDRDEVIQRPLDLDRERRVELIRGVDVAVRRHRGDRRGPDRFVFPGK